MVALRRLPGRLGRAFSFLLVLASLTVLSGCLQSEKLLLIDADFVQPMPDDFTLFSYTAAGDVFNLSVEGGKPKATHFARDGAGYKVVGEVGGLYFAQNGEGSYLAATTGSKGVLYTFVDIKGQALLLRYIAAEPEKDLERLRQTADGGAVLADVVYKDGSLIIPTREALFYLAERLRAGDFVLQGGPFYWLPGNADGTDPAVAPPATLDAEGNKVGDG